MHGSDALNNTMPINAISVGKAEVIGVDVEAKKFRVIILDGMFIGNIREYNMETDVIDENEYRAGILTGFSGDVICDGDRFLFLLEKFTPPED